ncbi:hypothetical protein GCM10010423_45950 [Streptomyces levis]|uniref:HNH nuclease domain-containing protein n=1 Tax=Streptomyces levis TaxID=285566 RepID=A0ABN3NWK2_9ACTN
MIEPVSEDAPVSEAGRKTILRMAVSRRRAGQIGRFGVGVKSVLVVYDHDVPIARSTTDAFGLNVTDVAGTVANGQQTLSSLARWAEVPPTQLRRMASVTENDAPPAWPEPVAYAAQKMRVRVVPVAAAYAAACDEVEEREAAGKHEIGRKRTIRRRDRDDEARRAVRLRSKGRCENPDCLLPGGYMPYRTAAGRPLLEVDHIDDHAAGGRDHPSAMIALCPNCHENKTYGVERDVLRERLRAITLERHQELLDTTPD